MADTSDFTEYRMLYAVVSELGQVIALTGTRWTADCLIAGIKANDSPTSKMGSWFVKPLAGE